jgi:hypothetical protein
MSIDRQIAFPESLRIAIELSVFGANFPALVDAVVDEGIGALFDPLGAFSAL